MNNSIKTIAVGLPSAQCHAYQHLPQHSLRLALCLNGVVPVRDMALADEPQAWIDAHMSKHYPEVSPGKTGPITIVLVL